MACCMLYAATANSPSTLVTLWLDLSPDPVSHVLLGFSTYNRNEFHEFSLGGDGSNARPARKADSLTAIPKCLSIISQ
jgi:hypothetical protein